MSVFIKRLLCGTHYSMFFVCLLFKPHNIPTSGSYLYVRVGETETLSNLLQITQLVNNRAKLESMFLPPLYSNSLKTQIMSLFKIKSLPGGKEERRWSCLCSGGEKEKEPGQGERISEEMNSLTISCQNLGGSHVPHFTGEDSEAQGGARFLLEKVSVWSTDRSPSLLASDLFSFCFTRLPFK